MPGRSPRRKGDRGENEIVQRHKALGVDAERRGYLGVKGQDVAIAGMLTAQVKRMKRDAKRGFTGVYKALGEADLLFIRRDYDKDPIVAMPWDWYVAMMTCWHESGCPTDFGAPTLAEQADLEEPTDEVPSG